MDTISLYYFSELSKDLHMTNTAERLYISQQTLSNHIKRLEDNLGVALFYRKPSLRLTYSGELLLDYAKTVLTQEKVLKDIISDVKGEERGIIRFGASAMRLSTCLPQILPIFSKHYPRVELRLINDVSANLEYLVLNDEIDFAIVTQESDNVKLKSTHLMEDLVYLCVSEELLDTYYGDKKDDLKEKAILGANIDDFSRLPFCMMSNQLGHKIQKAFEYACITPHVYITSSYTKICADICFKGLAAFFSSQMGLLSLGDQIPKNMNIFPFYSRDSRIIQSLNLIQPQNRYVPSYGKYFSSLLYDYFLQIETIQMSRVVR